MVVEWDRPLKYRRGSPRRLLGIDIYYDFEWLEVFPDQRAQFKNGQSLAQLVLGDCPAGKTPALLLTTRDEVEEATIETTSHFVVVVNLRRYLAQATADAAASYYARRLESGITSIAHLHELASRPDVITAVVERELSREHIASWVARDPARAAELRQIARAAESSDVASHLSEEDLNELASRSDVIGAVVDQSLQLDDIAVWAAKSADRLNQLRAIAESRDDARGKADIATAIGALHALETLDEEIVLAIEGLLGKDIDREAKVRFLRALTADRVGRNVTSEVLGQRLIDRLKDAREITRTYSSLLRDPSSTEGTLQTFIEQHPWLLGLEYVRVRPRRQLPRGQLDFILERYDGLHDVLELKGPHDPIIVAPESVDDVPPSASGFSLSRGLAQALAQVHVYSDVLSSRVEMLSEQYGLRNTRNARAFIVIGQAQSMPEYSTRILRDLNVSLHRIEIVPYDVLAKRASAVLDNVEQHLAASGATLVV